MNTLIVKIEGSELTHASELCTFDCNISEVHPLFYEGNNPDAASVLTFCQKLEPLSLPVFVEENAELECYECELGMRGDNLNAAQKEKELVSIG